MGWFATAERKRSRSGLHRRNVKRALSPSSHSAPSSSSSTASSAMGPLKGRALRAAYYSGTSSSSYRPASRLAGGRLGISGTIKPGNSPSNNVTDANDRAALVALPDIITTNTNTNTNTTNEQRVPIDEPTLESIQLETLSVLPESVYSMALAIIGSDTVRVMHESSYCDHRGVDENDDSNVDGSNVGGRILASLSRISLSAAPSAPSSGRSEETYAERAERRVGELVSALNGLVRRVGSVTQRVESWEEARAVLSEVLILPDEVEALRREEEGEEQEEEERREEEEARQEEGEVSVAGAAAAAARSRDRRGGRGTVTRFVDRRVARPGQRRAIRRSARRNLGVKKYAGMIQLARLESMRKWKQLTSTSVPPPIVKPDAAARLDSDDAAARRDGAAEAEAVSAAARPLDDAELSALPPMERSDRLLDRRLEAAEAKARAGEREEAERQDAAIAEREAREEAEAAAAEAAHRASSLLRDLTEEEEQIVRDAIYGIGPPDEVLASSDTDSVQRQSMHKLQPGVWLNDEVIHYFLLMLTRRDARLSEQDPSRKRCHFFKSFFVSKLLDEAGYKYANVKRWSKKVPGRDIFKLDKIFFPVNVGGMHWTVAVAFMQEKKIRFYDSMSGDGDRYLRGLMRYLEDEHQAKKGCPLPDADEWELVQCTPDTPQQENGFDCGVFSCMFCDFLSTDCPLAFSQEHITQCRERIALSIMKGVAIE